MFDFFGSKATAPTPVSAAPAGAPVSLEQQQQAPGNLPPAGDPNAQPPAGTVVPVVEETPADNSPLAPFKDMWDTKDNKEKEVVPAVQALDPAKLKEVVAKSDFSATITQENLAAITAGGEEATKAFAQSMNEVAQVVMNQSLLASNKMIEQAVDGVNKSWESKLPEIVRKLSLKETLVTNDPLYNNPAIKPIMDATQQALSAKYPDATVQELTTMTQDYIKAMGETFSPKPVTPASEKSSTDWNMFLTDNSTS